MGIQCGAAFADGMSIIWCRAGVGRRDDGDMLKVLAQQQGCIDNVSNIVYTDLSRTNENAADEFNFKRCTRSV